MERWTLAKRISPLLLAGATLSVILASCAAFNRTVIEVRVDDGPWMVSPVEVGDTELAFRFTNTGSQAHQPVMILTSRAPEELPVGEGRVDLSNIHIVWPEEGTFSDWPRTTGQTTCFRLSSRGRQSTTRPVPQARAIRGRGPMSSFVISRAITNWGNTGGSNSPKRRRECPSSPPHRL